MLQKEPRLNSSNMATMGLLCPKNSNLLSSNISAHNIHCRQFRYIKIIFYFSNIACKKLCQVTKMQYSTMCS